MASKIATMQSERGALMAIGGAEDRVRERIILSRFVALAGGPQARIAIVPTASGIEDAGQRYKAIFLDLGAASAEVAFVADREDAGREKTSRALQDATGIFIGGGNQLRLASVLGGTRFEAVIHERSAAGAVVGGTSAGASILSRHMVAFGSSGSGPRQRMAQLGAGFGLVEGAIIDQHFRERDRIGRLLTLVSLNPSLIGIGIDEDTAAIFHPDGQLEVLGRGTVIIVDGQQIVTDASLHTDQRAISVANITLHALASGARYDLATRTLLPLPVPPPAIKPPPLGVLLGAADDDPAK